MRHRITSLLLVAAACAAAPANAQFTAQRIASGLNQPIYLTSTGDDDRLFIVEQDGRILIHDGAAILTTPFLDIGGLVDFEGERGLLGLAFPPDYVASGFFYVHYSNLAGDSVLARYTVSIDPNVADAGSAEILLTVAQPFGNHNGGHIAFSPIDGFLYMALGDGGSGGDPGNRAQSTSTLLGKLLRIDVSSAPGYTVPPGNPGFAAPEIWAYGLRNPYRFSFDRTNGDLWIGDVGQDAVEEVNFQPALSPGGENYGWRCYEGSRRFKAKGCPPSSQLTHPVIEYRHKSFNQPFHSVTGGYRYRGPVSALAGLYFFADVGGAFFVADEVAPGVFSFGTAVVTPDAGSIDLVGGFGEDRDGDLYIVDLDGEIFRLGRVAPPLQCPATPLMGCDGMGKAQLVLRDAKSDGPGPGDELRWKGKQGPIAAVADFGDPSRHTATALCLYSGNPSALTTEVLLPSARFCRGKPCWKASSRGYRYTDRDQLRAGLRKLKLQTAASGSASLLVLARNGNVPLPSLPLDTSGDVIAQISNDAGGRCWESRFPAASVRRNDAGLFNARAP